MSEVNHCHEVKEKDCIELVNYWDNLFIRTISLRNDNNGSIYNPSDYKDNMVYGQLFLRVFKIIPKDAVYGVE